MTERGLPSTEGSPACPFVAFDDDRDARSDRPDHRHRCFAEAEPAPRALAHQEAYCLSSAFPVCPTFQAWARREAAQARSDRDAAAAAATAAAAVAGGANAGAPGPESHEAPGASGGPDVTPGAPGPEADEWTPGADDIPIESQPRRNPPRDWAAPPPWASGSGGSRGSSGAAGAVGGSGAAAGGQPAAPGFLTPRPHEGAGLAGSAADRLASGGSIADPGQGTARPPVAPPRSPSDVPSAGPDPELAGLVAGVAAGSAASGGAGRAAAPMTDEERIAAGYPPSTRAGRRPAVSSTRADRERDRDRERERAPQREHVQSSGPSWERAKRYEAYPTIKTRAGLGSLPALPRVAVLAAALGVAALALFFLPALLGMGGGEGGASPIPSATEAAVTPLPSPTPEPEPTPQIYVIKTGDTLSKIAKEFGITLDQLLEANKDTIEDPDKISVGDEIIIPAPPPDEVEGVAEESVAP